MDMTEIICKCGCGQKKMARTCDVKRGKDIYFSRSCASKHMYRKARTQATTPLDIEFNIFNNWLKNHVKCLTK